MKLVKLCCINLASDTSYRSFVDDNTTMLATNQNSNTEAFLGDPCWKKVSNDLCLRFHDNVTASRVRNRIMLISSESTGC